MTIEIATYLKYANLQIAAEAFIAEKTAAPWTRVNDITGDPLKAALLRGNERSSIFTTADAEWFSQDWIVVEQISNTTTGFSGTLFRALKNDPERGISAGELVLSFRSTEFVDDAARDNQATNVMEIKAEGWAFGQISDMRKWVDSLNDNGKINAPLTVTGYSLGGHLATAFNRLYPGAATATYTFNGAGVGTVKEGTDVAQAMNVFRDHRVLGSNVDLFSAEEPMLTLYNQYSDLFKEGASVTLAQVIEAINVVEQIVQFTSSPSARIFYDALNRVRQVVSEAERVNAGISSGTGNPVAQEVVTSNIAATALDYQLAVLRAGEYTEGYRTDLVSTSNGVRSCLLPPRRSRPLAEFPDAPKMCTHRFTNRGTPWTP